MSTFRRYLIYFSVIGYVIVSIGLVLIMQDKEILKISYIAFFILLIVIAVFIMSLVFSDMASSVDVKIYESADKIMDSIDKIAIKKCNRKVKECRDGKIFYKMTGKINSWLTNPIVVSKYDGYVIVSVPNGYVNYFKRI